MQKPASALAVRHTACSPKRNRETDPKLAQSSGEPVPEKYVVSSISRGKSFSTTLHTSLMLIPLQSTLAMSLLRFVEPLGGKVVIGGVSRLVLVTVS